MENIKIIPLDKIIVVSNIRSNNVDPGFIAELAQSISEVGLIQPISVTFDEEQEVYRLITGHRRYLAVKSLNQETIVATVLPEMDESAVMEYQLIENIQRETVTAIEEAQAFGKLIRESHFTTKQIARTIGKTQRYVDTRILLNNLIPEVAIFVHSGKLTLQHATLFSQCSPLDQEKLLYRLRLPGIDDPTFEGPRELKRYIKMSVVHPLANAPFDFEDAKLYKKAGSCLKCPKRSGANKNLFETIDSEDDCFDPVCYAEKVKLFMDNIRDQYTDVVVHFLTEKWTPKQEQIRTGIEYAPFLRQFDMPKGKPMKDYPLKEIGIWIDANDPTKNGTAVQILTPEQYTRYNEKDNPKSGYSSDEESQTEGNGDELKKFREHATSFIKATMNEIALKVASSDVVKIPEAMLRIIGLNLIEKLDNEDRNSVYKHFGWVMEIPATNDDDDPVTINHENAEYMHVGDLFQANIYRYSGRDLNEVIIYLMLLEIGGRSIDSRDIDSDFIYAVEMAQELKIDTAKTLDAIEKEHGVELKKYFLLKN